MTNAPKWAAELVAQVAADYGRETLPFVTWRRARPRGITAAAYLRRVNHEPNPRVLAQIEAHPPKAPSSSGGRCMRPNLAHPNGRIIVTAGTDRKDQRLVLLHELAHWLRPVGESHSSAFWDQAFELYQRYGVSIKYATERESRYRVGAAKAIERLTGRTVKTRPPKRPVWTYYDDAGKPIDPRLRGRRVVTFSAAERKV